MRPFVIDGVEHAVSSRLRPILTIHGFIPSDVVSIDASIRFRFDVFCEKVGERPFLSVVLQGIERAAIHVQIWLPMIGVVHVVVLVMTGLVRLSCDSFTFVELRRQCMTADFVDHGLGQLADVIVLGGPGMFLLVVSNRDLFLLRRGDEIRVSVGVAVPIRLDVDVVKAFGKLCAYARARGLCSRFVSSIDMTTEVEIGRDEGRGLSGFFSF